jgi:hypothetical protein
MENAVSQRSAGLVRWTAILAFTAYAACSVGYASSSWWAMPLYAQTLIYLAVAVALWRRRSWAPWFAIGIALSGLAIDLLFLGVYVVGPEFALDTAAQGVLVALAWRTRTPVVPPAWQQLTSGSPARIGWTFALTAGVLPPMVMAALAPVPQLACFETPVSFGEKVWLTLIPLAAVGSLQLIARLRAAGVLLMALTCAAGAAALGGSLVTSWHVWSLWDLRPEHFLALVGQAFLVAALVPLAPTFARVLFARR